MKSFLAIATLIFVMPVSNVFAGVADAKSLGPDVVGAWGADDRPGALINTKSLGPDVVGAWGADDRPGALIDAKSIGVSTFGENNYQNVQQSDSASMELKSSIQNTNAELNLNANF